jgi:uncharacterized protein YpmB
MLLKRDYPGKSKYYVIRGVNTALYGRGIYYVISGCGEQDIAMNG